MKTCFYLVNPTFKGKKIFLLANSDLVITYSEAKRNLYSNELKGKTIIISKSIDENHPNSGFEYKSQHLILYFKGFKNLSFIQNDYPLTFICTSEKPSNTSSYSNSG